MKQPDLHPYIAFDPERRLSYQEKRFPQPPYVWRPRMTGQQRAEQEAYIKKHNLPF